MAAAAPAFSVAVLSFENRSRDSSDTFLGDGLADEIATQLGGVQKLTVRSRTMVRRLAGAGTMAPPALGRALQAAYLVDGSIQRAGTQLRVQVTLLRSASGDQAWAQTYDRPAADLFQIQSDIARSVSEAIVGRLLPQERASLARAPTRNAEAYPLYLRARALGFGSVHGGDATAVAALERAVAMDSSFAEAWAQLSRQRMWMWWSGIDRGPANLAAALGAAERARRLTPDGVEAHLAMGYYYYWGSRDYARALAELNAALRLRPNDADTWDAMANISRRQGHWDASIEQRNRAVALEPGGRDSWVELSLSLWSMRRYDEALALADSASRHGADTLVVELIRGGILHVSQGLEQSRPHYRRAFGLAGSTLYVTPIPLMSGAFGGDTVFWRWADRLQRPAGSQRKAWYSVQAWRWLGAGDTTRFTAFADSLRAMLEHDLALDSTDVEGRMNLAQAYSLLGRHGDALRESERAVREMPRSLDDYSGSQALYFRAYVLAHAGRADEAVTLLEQLLSLPTGHFLSKLTLRIDPDWAVLRGNPGFERLIN